MTMELWTVTGVVVSIAAFGLALIAIARGAPPVNIERDRRRADGFTIWNSGPGDVVVREIAVYVPIAADSEWLPAGDMDPEVVFLDERLGAWRSSTCEGTVLPPQERYELMVGVNTSMRIRYRAGGLLGRLARAEVMIHGDV